MEKSQMTNTQKLKAVAELDSPYGYITVQGRKYYNGHPVDLPTHYPIDRSNGQLRGVEDCHQIPEHWVKVAESTAAINAAAEIGGSDEK